MDIYSFINSRDIAEHCRKIGHEFTPLEMAVIICKSLVPLKQRHEAYREIIANYPDMPFHKSVDFKIKDSLHHYLRKLVDLEEKALNDFYNPQANRHKIYTITRSSLAKLGIYKPSDNEPPSFMDMVESGKASFTIDTSAIRKREIEASLSFGNFSTIEELLEAVRVYWDKDKIEDIRVVKTKLNARRKFADIDYNGEIRWLDSSYSEKLHQSMYGMKAIFIHIPVPFENGDIVRGVLNGNNYPHLLIDLPHSRKGYTDAISGSDCDEMSSAHYYKITDGELNMGTGALCTIDMEYYRGEKTKDFDALSILSKKIKTAK